MHLDNFNLGLYIATYIFDSISLGFLTRSVSSLLQHMIKEQNPELIQYDTNSLEKGKPKEKLNFWPFRILTVVLLAAVIINIVGTSELSEGDTSSMPLIKASSILFLIGVVMIIALLVLVHLQSAQFSMIAKVLIAASVILIIRCIYSLLSAFHGISFSQPSKYMIYFGQYKYYTFLGFLPESLAGILILIAFWYW
ncbi:unnamed protein product [Candida verbasci]|uniref:DUF7702 domain-containing protein n=1 Tax=Candida verbasci TaxID=1227364 RepID=A0A9W4TSQ8_9ASCO|nr:unnamed protein product [Candida verbasci]